jgi:hypothetical protein
MRISYARASTAGQNPGFHEDALQKAGCEKIFRDIASGAVDSGKGLLEASNTRGMETPWWSENWIASVVLSNI